LLDAALPACAHSRYYKSRFSDIALEAGIASGTIYLYFQPQDDVLVTVFREEMAEWVALVQKEVAAERDPLAKIRKIVALHSRMIHDNPELAEVVQVELRQGHKFFRGASAHEVSAYFDVIQSVLEEGVAAGRFRRDLPLKVATKMLFGAMDQLATSWVLGKRAYRLADAAEPPASISIKGQ